MLEDKKEKFSVDLGLSLDIIYKTLFEVTGGALLIDTDSAEQAHILNEAVCISVETQERDESISFLSLHWLILNNRLKWAVYP